MIESYFPTPIYVHKPVFQEIFLIQQEVDQALPEIRKDNFMTPLGWECEVKTNISHRWHTIQDFKLKNLENYFEKHLSLYVNGVEPYITADLTMFHSWVNLYDKGHSQEWHTHSDSFISGIYYHKTNGKDGRLAFKNPVPFTKTGLFPAGSKITEKNYITPVPGMIVLFPGWLEHSVEVNSTDHERISIAVNWLTLNADRPRKGLIKQ